MAVSLTAARANAMLENLADRANSGSLAIYGGSVPSNADAPLSGNPELVRLELSGDAFGAPVLGVMTANAIDPAYVSTTGTATFYRMYDPYGTCLVQGTVGPLGDLHLGVVDLVDGAEFAIGSYTLRLT
jgi:hypothetical protein